MKDERRELADRLEALSNLEPGWYANVGKKTGEQCCAAMREAAQALRSQPSVEEVARVIARELDTTEMVLTDPLTLHRLKAERIARQIASIYTGRGET